MANAWPIHGQFMSTERPMEGQRASPENRKNRTANNRPNRPKAGLQAYVRRGSANMGSNCAHRP
eukprot:14733-Lingulodinium_polyedra.AAC.1